MAIIDPNNNARVMSAAKLSDGSTQTDFGCRDILTRYFRDAAKKESRVLMVRRLLWAASDVSRCLAINGDVNNRLQSGVLVDISGAAIVV